MYTLTFEDRELLGCIAIGLPFIIYGAIYLVSTWYLRVWAIPHKTKRFVFCEGSKNKVLWVEMVNARDFARYDKIVGYGVIDMNSNSIYFDARQEQ